LSGRVCRHSLGCMGEIPQSAPAFSASWPAASRFRICIGTMNLPLIACKTSQTRCRPFSLSLRERERVRGDLSAVQKHQSKVRNQKGARSSRLGILRCACVFGLVLLSFVTAVVTPHPPGFFTGPASVLLTNRGGYSARLNVQTEGFAEYERNFSGQLLCLGGKLFFAPDSVSGSGKKDRYGGFSFIWDTAENR
jgi:hypothetical protein